MKPMRRERFRLLAWLAPTVAAGMVAAACTSSGAGSSHPSPTPQGNTTIGVRPPVTSTATSSSASRQASRHSPPTGHTTHPKPPPRTTTQAAQGPPPGGVTAIGDSVMIDAASSLKADIPGIAVDAAVSRQVGDGLALVESLRRSGRLGRTVVFHLGTNGQFPSSQLDQLVQLTAGRHLIVLTSHCPYCGWTPGNNAMIRSSCVAARHCTVADWARLADANPSWFTGDGVHMPIGGPGAQAYAGLVARTL